MGKSLDEMAKNGNKMEYTTGISIRSSYVGTDSKTWIALEGKEWGPDCFDRIAAEIELYELAENNLQLTHETILISVVGAFANFVQVAYKEFVKHGYEWSGGGEDDPLVIAARHLFLWKWKNREAIKAHLLHRQAEIETIKKIVNCRTEFAEEIYITQYFVESWIKDKTPPKLIGSAGANKHPNAVIVPAPRSLGYLVHSSENEAVNKFFAYGWYNNEQVQDYPIRATRSGGKYLKKTHVTITPFFKAPPPVLANLVYFHAVEIGRLHRLDSDNKDDPFGPHYFTAESVVRQLTGTRKNGAELRGLEIYQEVVDTLLWLKENRHTFDGRHFVDTRCKDQNRQRLYVKDPILNWRIDPEARIDGSLTEVYIFDRIPPMFWMTDELARLRRIKSARFMPEGPSAPRRNGSFLALFDAAFEPICRQAYFIANGVTEERAVPVYLHDDLAKNRTGVFSSAGMKRPEDCSERTYKSNREKLTKIFDHLEKIGMLTYKPITEGRKIIGYMLTIINERLIFGAEEERKEAQKVLDKPLSKKG